MGRVRVELDLEIGEEPIRGEIGALRGERAGFTGWLELIGALDQLRDPERPGKTNEQEGP